MREGSSPALPRGRGGKPKTGTVLERCFLNAGSGWSHRAAEPRWRARNAGMWVADDGTWLVMTGVSVSDGRTRTGKRGAARQSELKSNRPAKEIHHETQDPNARRHGRGRRHDGRSSIRPE